MKSIGAGAQSEPKRRKESPLFRSPVSNATLPTLKITKMGPLPLLFPLPLASHCFITLRARLVSPLSPRPSPSHHHHLFARFSSRSTRSTLAMDPSAQFTFSLQPYPRPEFDPTSLAPPPETATVLPFSPMLAEPAIFELPAPQQPPQAPLYWYPTEAYGSYHQETSYHDAGPGDISPDLPNVDWSRSNMYSMPDQFQHSFDDLPSTESNYCLSPSYAPEAAFSPYEPMYSMPFTPTLSQSALPLPSATTSPAHESPLPIHAEPTYFATSTPHSHSSAATGIWTSHRRRLICTIVPLRDSRSVSLCTPDTVYIPHHKSALVVPLFDPSQSAP